MSQVVPIKRIWDIECDLSVKTTARLLSVPEKSIYRWIKQEIVPAYKNDEQYRFNRAELLEWATSRIIAREELSSTVIGTESPCRIRNPVLLHVTRPTVTLCSLVITLISPNLRAHLHLLSRLGFVLRHPEFRQVLDPPESREEILTTLRRVEGMLS
jgi:excisionase family DNA binding protein